jgi:hypothetical protein
MVRSDTTGPQRAIGARRLFWWLYALTPPALVLALYGPVLRLPFFWDDVANFTFMEGRSLASFWVSAAGFPYYRPLGFSLFRVWQWLFGSTNTAAFHALNVLVLVCNGWLMGALALRLWSDATKPERALDRRELYTPAAELFAWLTSALLCAFPFAAIVVPLVASFFHLLVTALVLLAGLAMLCYRRGGRRHWGVLMVACAALAPFAHESGIAAGLALGALWFCLDPNGVRQDSSAILWSGKVLLATSLALNGLFPLWWSRVDKMRAESGLPVLRPLSELWHNTVFFLDALTFPLQPLVRLLAQGSSWSEVRWVAMVGFLGLACTGVLLWRAGKTRLLLAGLGFFASLSLPAILMLPKLYVVVSPRLTVLPAAGAALLWGAVMSVLALHNRRGLLLAALLGAVLLLVPARYILSRVDLHTRALAPVWGLARAARSFPYERHLVVNATTWLALADHTYPIVHDGVVVIPEYHHPGSLAGIHTGGVPRMDGVNFPLVAQEPERHYYDVWGEVLHWEAMAGRLRQYDRVWLTTYGDGPLGFVEVGNVLAQHAVTDRQTALANFDNGRIRLLSGAVRQASAGELLVEMQWQLHSASSEDVFVHAFDCAGNLLGMADGPPLGRMFPFWLWLDGERARDVRTIVLEEVPSDGCARVEVGLFSAESGARVSARDADGQLLSNQTLVLNLAQD